MSRVRFIMVGGFLGAGKTTALASLARRYVDAGRRVGLITNDQAAGLVDTGMLRADGFGVAEIAGGCFCCRFDELAEAAARLHAESRPEILLGEPVGSCTDLVATVLTPLKKIYGEAYAIAPYSVLIDPERAGRMFLGTGFGGFSSNVAYIYRKQLEESDAIVINKIDRLSPRSEAALIEALSREFPRKRLFRLSALTGEGIDSWIAFLEESGPFGRNLLEIDYDTYAEGEAELGWLNATVSLRAADGIRGDDLALDVVTRLALRFAGEGIEPAHLKVLFADGPDVAVANLVRSGAEPVLSRVLDRTSRSGNLTINARVHAAPPPLRRAVEEVIGDVARERGIELNLDRSESFKPARPIPRHRETEPVP